MTNNNIRKPRKTAMKTQLPIAVPAKSKPSQSPLPPAEPSTVKTCDQCAEWSYGRCKRTGTQGHHPKDVACEFFTTEAPLPPNTCSQCLHCRNGWCEVKGETGKGKKSPACDKFGPKNDTPPEEQHSDKPTSKVKKAK